MLTKLFSALLSFVIVHLFYVVLGFAFVFISITHKFGLRFLAMSFFPSLCGKYCKLDCQNVKCGNWTCPYYHKGANKCKQ